MATTIQEPTVVARGDRQATLRGLLSEDLVYCRWLEELALAPNGSAVAYTVKRVDLPNNTYLVDVFVTGTAENDTPIQLNAGTGSASSLTWSPDSHLLAYVWSDVEGTTLRVREIATGAEQAYPFSEGAPSDLDFSPDGQRIAFARWQRVVLPGDPDLMPHIGPTPDVRVIRRLRYKRDGLGFVHDRYRHIFVLHRSNGAVEQLTDGECDYSSPRWNSRGDHLVFVGEARELNTNLGQGQLFLYDYPGGTPRLLMPDWVGACTSPVWGDEDRTIAFAGHQGHPPLNRRLIHTVWAVDVATGTTRHVTPDLDYTVGNYAVADQRKALTNITVRWPRESDTIWFLATVEGATHLYNAKADGSGYGPVLADKSIVFEFSPATNGTIAYGMASPSNMGDLYLLNEGESRRLTTLNPWLSSRVLSDPEEYWYDGLEGAKVHAWVMKPVGFQEGKRYPTICYVHCSMFSWDFNHEFQALAARGYVVAFFNQRGTTAGYGQAWTRASEGDQGGKDYEEILLGVDELVRRPYVDGDRLGVTGGSCGGFLTNWIIGHTDRFKAAVTQRSITNQISMFGTSDIGPECTEWETRTNPWRDLQASWRQSPIAYVERINTPLLIVHSDEDFRCPIEQAEQLFAAMRWMGKEVEFVWFVGENHSLSRGGRPANRIEHQRRIAGWFDKYLGAG